MLIRETDGKGIMQAFSLFWPPGPCPYPALYGKGRIMKTKTGLLALVWIISLSYLSAADFWDKKPYTDWKQKECDKAP